MRQSEGRSWNIEERLKSEFAAKENPKRARYAIIHLRVALQLPANARQEAVSPVQYRAGQSLMRHPRTN
jgi:hypothetical protein